MTNNNIPIHSYSNADTQKKQILIDNKGKTGIYRWNNTITGDSYIGSAINLSKRLNDYLNIAFLNKELKKGRSIIYNALLKYGYSNFRLDILEYCHKFNLIEREQYYFDNLNPKYNILKVAGSLYGFKHSIKTIERLRIINIGRKHSEASKMKMSLNSSRSKSIGVIIKNIENNIIMEFSSITEASKHMGILAFHFRSHLDRQPIKGKYLIIKINNENYTVKPK